WIMNHLALCGVLVAAIAAAGKIIQWRYEVRNLRYDEKRRTREDKIVEITRKIEQIDERVMKEKKAINVTVPEEMYFAEIKEDPVLIREALRRRRCKEKTNRHFNHNPLIRKTL